MADVLSQSEVDALLQAVGGGEDTGGFDLSSPTGAAPAAPGASPAAAAAPKKKARPQFEDKNVTIYDFKRPNRVSPEQMRALSSLHEQFARNLAAELTGVLRTLIDIQASQAEQLTFQEFTMSLPNPTSITVLSCEPLSGEIVLELNPTICFPVIDKLLGGGHAAAAAPERAFTEIETRLISQIVDHIIHNLQEVWTPVANLHFSVVDTETNPQILQNVAPNEIVVLLTFEVRMSEGEAGGMLNLCLPFNVIEPIMGSLSSQSWFMDRSRAGKEDAQRIRTNLQDVNMTLECFIAETDIALRDFRNLKPGDIITTSKLARHPVLAHIGGKPKFRATMGQIRGHKAMRIEGRARETDKINL